MTRKVTVEYSLAPDHTQHVATGVWGGMGQGHLLRMVFYLDEGAPLGPTEALTVDEEGRILDSQPAQQVGTLQRRVVSTIYYPASALDSLIEWLKTKRADYQAQLEKSGTSSDTTQPAAERKPL